MQFQVQKHWEHTQGKCIDSKGHIYISLFGLLFKSLQDGNCVSDTRTLTLSCSVEESSPVKDNTPSTFVTSQPFSWPVESTSIHVSSFFRFYLISSNPMKVFPLSCFLMRWKGIYSSVLSTRPVLFTCLKHLRAPQLVHEH